jgi:hypothetical protein
MGPGVDAHLPLDLPLNLDQNRHNSFHNHLKDLQAKARRPARELPISA